MKVFEFPQGNLSGNVLQELKLKPKSQTKLFLKNQTLSKLEAIDCSLRYSDFRSSKLTHLVLEESDLMGSNFSNSYISSGSFERGNLAGASFRGSYLKNCDFTGANLSSCDFRGTKLNPPINFRGAILYNCDFTDSVGIDNLPIQSLHLSGAVFDSGTHWAVLVLQDLGIKCPTAIRLFDCRRFTDQTPQYVYTAASSNEAIAQHREFLKNFV